MRDEITGLKERLSSLEVRVDSIAATMALKQRLEGERQREFTDITCADCGKTDRINFKPRYPGKLYCRT